jgi:hypothetical protein
MKWEHVQVGTIKGKWNIFDRDKGDWLAVVYDIEANAQLIATAPELLEEHKVWAKNIGEALIRVLQKDYSLIDILAKTTNIDFTSGEPVLRSEAIDKAEGR